MLGVAEPRRFGLGLAVVRDLREARRVPDSNRCRWSSRARNNTVSRRTVRTEVNRTGSSATLGTRNPWL